VNNYISLYEELGVRKVINASGAKTHLGGSIPDLKVMNAMKEASQSFVIMMELMEKTGEIIAKVTNAEAGLITSGSSAALVLATAACIMRNSGLEKFMIQPVERLNLDEEWRDLIQTLPDASCFRNEIIIQNVHRNPFDHAFKVAGGKLIVVGTEKFCSLDDLKNAITDKTAAIAFTAHLENEGIPLNRVIEIAHNHNIPVIVDAAAELPPRSNLKRFIMEGADLVAFSGGKHINGPNDTGILCGKKDLVKIAKLQSSPYRGIGRAMKVDRTQMVGLITALRIWLNKNEEEELDGWRAKAKSIVNSFKNKSQVTKAEILEDKRVRGVHVQIAIKEKNGLLAKNIVFNLRKGDPSIWVDYIKPNKIDIDPSMLKNEEVKILVTALTNILDNSFQSMKKE
jgi:L-seryl-tRNA(Ser) seleniumtransferase